jgi:hypothetical protein
MDTSGLVMDVLVTPENFDEQAYLASNPDVAAAVRGGRLASGRKHFDRFGYKEGRRQRAAKSDAPACCRSGPSRGWSRAGPKA